ncbi:MAG: cupin domain-containing protein [Acinetobacter sp.]|nr:cupin domain-containing protein [Acinetobacter sp.]MDN5433203.1 cupin domain-containing protein [Acinetobacter sp.]MDN5489781.1 cupin domain-containing protein [Acinetobacter sp.]MDN5623722.1 cupin domain-containing protein [Acinetobacter sp.]MDN5648559.1 cupin domain-containing protein [Acinetobacter sp.]
MNINAETFKSLEVLFNTTELSDDEWINFPEYGFRQYFLWKNVDTGATIALLEFQKGGCIPIKHTHASNQFMFCLEGEYEYIDVELKLKSGCFYMNPKDHPHGPTLAHQFSRLIEIYDGPHYYEKPAYHTDESISDFVKKENQENRLEQ